MILLLLLAAMSTGCNGVRPGPGEEAVLVMKPWIFGHGGIDETPIKTGLAWVAPSTSEVIVNMQPMQFEEKYYDLMSRDGVPLSFDTFTRVQVLDSVKLIRDWGENWYANNIQAEYGNRVRQAVKKHGLNETAIETSAIEEIDDEVTNGPFVYESITDKDGKVSIVKTAKRADAGMVGYLATLGIPVKLLKVNVGRANPPDSVKNQRIETAAEQQRALTQGQRKLAEDARKAAENSRAQADQEYQKTMKMDTHQFIALEQIRVMHEVCNKQDAHCNFVVGQVGATVAVPLGTTTTAPVNAN